MTGRYHKMSVRREALRLYVEKDMTAKEVGEAMGLPPTTVANWAVAEGVSRRKGPRVRSAIRARAEKLYGQGLTFRDIEAALGVPWSTVANWIQGAGLARPRGARGNREARALRESHKQQKVLR